MALLRRVRHGRRYFRLHHARGEYAVWGRAPNAGETRGRGARLVVPAREVQRHSERQRRGGAVLSADAGIRRGRGGAALSRRARRRAKHARDVQARLQPQLARRAHSLSPNPRRPHRRRRRRRLGQAERRRRRGLGLLPKPTHVSHIRPRRIRRRIRRARARRFHPQVHKHRRDRRLRQAQHPLRAQFRHSQDTPKRKRRYR